MLRIEAHAGDAENQSIGPIKPELQQHAPTAAPRRALGALQGNVGRGANTGGGSFELLKVADCSSSTSAPATAAPAKAAYPEPEAFFFSEQVPARITAGDCDLQHVSRRTVRAATAQGTASSYLRAVPADALAALSSGEMPTHQQMLAEARIQRRHASSATMSFAIFNDSEEAASNADGDSDAPLSVGDPLATADDILAFLCS